MGAGFNALAQAGVQNKLAQAEHNRNVTTDERQQREQWLHEQASSGAINPTQYSQGMNDLYAHEPVESRFGRIGRGLERVVGMKKTADRQKQNADAQYMNQPSPNANFANLQAEAKTPQQLFVERAAADNASNLQFDKQKSEQDFSVKADWIRQNVPQEDQAAAMADLARKQAGIFASAKSISGAAGQPVEFPPGSGTYAKAVNNPDGTIAMLPMPEGWKPAPPKPSTTPKIGTSNGKNVYATLTPEGWKSTLDGKVLQDFRPLPTYAQTGNFAPVETVTPEGVGVGSFNRKTGKTTESMGNTKTLPPSVAKDLNASLQAAVSARTRLRTMKLNVKDALAGNQQAMLSLVANHIGMTLGAQKGARINQAVWNEAINTAPWLQTAAAKWSAEGYLSGVTLAPKQINQMLALAEQQANNMQQQVQDTAQSVGLKLPAPKSDNGEKAAAVVQHSPSTGQYRYSTDGGNTWNPGQPPK